MALRNLDNAFTNFFKKRAQYPNFKKKSRHQSFQYPQGVKIRDCEIFLPKIGWVRFNKSRDILGEIKTVTVSKTPTGKIYVSVLCDTKLSIPKKKPITEITTVGIDLGIKSFAVTSDGEVFENKKYLRRNLSRLRIEQRKLQRCKRGSINREKQRIIVAKIHERITNQRLDYIHKFTTSIVQCYDTICLEDLSSKNMMHNHKLAQALSDISIGKFNDMIEYKAKDAGVNILRIGRFEPSSKMCSCGHINKTLKLSDRNWTCPVCHVNHDRDLLAANNIKRFAFSTNNTAGAAEIQACGDMVTVTDPAHEANCL